MANSADPDQLASSGYCLQMQGISGFSRTRVKKKKSTDDKLPIMQRVKGANKYDIWKYRSISKLTPVAKYAYLITFG